MYLLFIKFIYGFFSKDNKGKELGYQPGRVSINKIKLLWVEPVYDCKNNFCLFVSDDLLLISIL